MTEFILSAYSLSDLFLVTNHEHSLGVIALVPYVYILAHELNLSFLPNTNTGNCFKVIFLIYRFFRFLNLVYFTVVFHDFFSVDYCRYYFIYVIFSLQGSRVTFGIAFHRFSHCPSTYIFK